MILKLLVAVALAAPLSAAAQDAAQSAPQDPPKRIRNVILYGEDKCPEPSDGEEIVVCANAGESPYRIPKRFRDEAKTTGDSVAWARRLEQIEDVNRIGLPMSCSPVGSMGQTGCTRAFIRQWAQERLEKQVKDAEASGD